MLSDAVHACYMLADDDAEGWTSSLGMIGLRSFAETCEALRFGVRTFEHEEFSVLEVYAFTFGAQACFSIQSRWFLVRVAIVPCKVPLLFPFWLDLA